VGQGVDRSGNALGNGTSFEEGITVTLRAWTIFLCISATVLLAACDESGTMGNGDPGGPPFDLDGLACEHPFVNERLGGVHYWLVELDEDGAFEATFPNTATDRVVGSYDSQTGALSATITFDDGYAVDSEEIEGTVQFEADGDSSGTYTAIRTYRDGWIEEQERTASVQGCTREVSWSYLDRAGDLVEVAVTTTFTSEMTADETAEGTASDGRSVTYDSELLADFSRADHIVMEDDATAVSPDQVTDRVILGDGSGTGTYVSYREDDGHIDGDWEYHADGDQEGDWEMTLPSAPQNPVGWGHTIHRLDGSSESDYTKLTAGGEVDCHSEVDVYGHGFTECDDGTYEEF